MTSGNLQRPRVIRGAMNATSAPGSAGLPRRTVAAALVAAPALWLGARAQPATTRVATPAQTEGPFYPVQLPADADNDLLRNGALNYRGGQPTWVDGVVTDLDGKTLARGTGRDLAVRRARPLPSPGRRRSRRHRLPGLRPRQRGRRRQLPLPHHPARAVHRPHAAHPRQGETSAHANC